MKRRIRNILFTTFALLFMIVGGYLALTAQGFVIDFKNLKIEKNGAIFLKFTPRDANLFINGHASEYKQSGLLEPNGVIIKNLAPGEYRLKLSKNDYNDWEKNLEVRSGLITSESQITLWPKEPRSETLAENVRNFRLTKKGVVYENKNGQIIFDGSVIRGSRVFLSKNDSETIVTKDEADYFLVNLENPRSAVNITHLFNSLKQRQLDLPGYVPVKDVFFHPFSPGKLVIISETSLYIVDAERIQIEKLVTLERIKSAVLGANDAFVLDEEDNLTIINFLLKTSLSGPVELKSVKDLKINSDGTNLFFLTSENELKIYRRSSGKTENLATGVKEFKLSPEEKRIAVLATDNKLKIAYSEEWKGDVRFEAGTVAEIPAVFGANAKELKWLADFPNYVTLLDGGNLRIQEIDTREPDNFHFILEKVSDYEINGKEIYILKENGELIFFATAAVSAPF